MKNHLSKIRSRLILYFLAIIVFFVVSFFLTTVLYKNAEAKFNDQFNQYVKINDAFTGITKAHTLLKSYTTEPKPEKLDDFRANIQNAHELLRLVKEESDNKEDRRVMTDLGYMIETYQEKAEQVIDAAEEKRQAPYSLLEESEFVSRLISYRFEKQFAKIINDMEALRAAMDEKEKQQTIATILSILFASIAGIAMAISFSRSISVPIRHLERALVQVAGGNLNIEPVAIESHDELQSLAHSLNEMVSKIRFYINELENKVELERKLREEEKELLETKALLRQTQIYALQAKMNPHFLFNALNLVSQTAYLEGSEKTSELLTAINEILRYNIDKSDLFVHLREEVRFVYNYMYIQRMRFDERISFSMDVQPDLIACKVPSLCIQPFVENAVIHGVGNRREGGAISLFIARQGDFIHIEIRDNGVGMDAQKVDSLLAGRDEDTDDARKSIGIRNVCERLKLHYGADARINVQSSPGEGTTVVLILPYRV